MSIAPTAFHDWFAAQGWTPFAFQEAVWAAYLNGESGLIHSPTGTGKTLAAWGGAIIDYLSASPLSAGKSIRRAQTPPLTVLWITPMRALAADTAHALQAPLTALGLDWSLETRTGDTSSTVRGRQRARLPTALVTTPESLSLLLARADADSQFAALKLVVVDEWHELLSSKRGVQVELALARLRRIAGSRPSDAPPLRTWGVSATMGNLDAALRTLIGRADVHTGEVPTGRLIRGALNKAIIVETLLPAQIERFPWAGHIGLTLLARVIDQIAAGGTALVFTNTRFQTERWYEAIIDARPDWIGQIALHHSALDRDKRAWVEAALRAGTLRAVVCTSSLDLGVDFPAVDRVFQIGSPKGTARLMQRAGRSGHQPGAPSRVICVPAHALELLEIAAARRAIQTGQIEDRIPIDKPLDTLAQHLITVALGGGFLPDDLYREVRTTWAFRDLTPDEWAWTLDFVAQGGALGAYDEFRRLEIDGDGRYVVARDAVARMHRLSIGTIMGDANLEVQYIRGAKLGTIEESFAARLQPGDKFTLAGKTLEFVRIREMKVWVRAARGGKGVIPRWVGGGLPLSESLADGVRALLIEMTDEIGADSAYGEPEVRALRPLLQLQAKWSRLPTPDMLLIESCRTRDGHHLFFYPFAGRLAHEGLAALFAYRIARIRPITFTMAVNDYGFELLSPDPAPLTDALNGGLTSKANLIDDIEHSLNAAELARRQFREIARVAGLVQPRFPGGQKTMKQLQASSGLLYDVFAQYDPDNLLLEQARREVLARQLDIERIQSALTRIGAGTIIVTQPPRPTPFAFPLLVERMRQTLSSETLEDRVRKLQVQYETWADR
jgi:ATP-dependent Lhr-like helicase